MNHANQPHGDLEDYTQNNEASRTFVALELAGSDNGEVTRTDKTEEDDDTSQILLQGDVNESGHNRLIINNHTATASFPTLRNYPQVALRQFCYHQVSWLELSGSCGDLGTFLPLLGALAQADLIHPGPALLYAGLANVVAGIIWNCPMPVQPMKSIAATALWSSTAAANSSPPWTAFTVTAAGLWMGTLMLLIGIIPSLMTTIQWLVPRSVVSGVQVGVGAALAVHGLQQAFQQIPFWPTIGGSMESWDCGALALLCGLVTLYTLRPASRGSSGSSTARRTQTPIAIILFALASVLAVLRVHVSPESSASRSENSSREIYWWGLPAYKYITKSDWVTGFWEGALPQLPLTLLNSVISLCCLADSLFPERRSSPTHLPIRNNDDDVDGDERNHATTIEEAVDASTMVLQPRHVALSVGCLNLLACPLGAMPICHGAGGLAGQYTFGARFGTSIVILGLAKMLVACLSGPERLLRFLQALPRSILGVLLMVAGHELALTGLSSLNNPTPVVGHSSSSVDAFRGAARTELSICLWTALVIIGLHKTHYGALTGCLAYVLYYKGNACCRWE